MELTNGIGLAAYRGFITNEARVAALAALDDDFDRGRYRQGDRPKCRDGTKIVIL